MINRNLEATRWCLPVGSAGAPRRRLRIAFAAVGVSLAVALAPAAPAQAHGGYYFDAHDPFSWYSKMGSKGHLNMTYSHGWARIRVFAQRRVCGFWGCNFQNKAEVSRTMDFSNNQSGELLAWQYCEPGTHRYRTRTIIEIREPTYMYTNSKISNEVTRTC